MKIIRILIYIWIISFFVLTGFIYANFTGNVVAESKIVSVNMTRAVDGDTIDTTIGRVRMLGINTPEKKQAGYAEAKAFMQGFENKTVELEMITEDKDQYGRILRYVFYDGNFVNKEVLERGLAHFYTYHDDKYTEELKKAEEIARNFELGIWEKSEEKCGSCIILIELNEIDPGEYVELGNRCGFDCDLEGWRIDDDSSSHTRILNFLIATNGEERLDYNGSIWNDDGDSLYLRDKEGRLALFYRY